MILVSLVFDVSLPKNKRDTQCDELLKSAYQNAQTFEQMHLYTQRESKGCEIRVITGR